MHNTNPTEIFIPATAIQNCYGQTVLDFLMDYWTVSKFMVKFPPTGKRQMFYLVLNNIGEYIHLLKNPVLNARALSCLEVHVQLTATGAVTVNQVKLLHSFKPNYCGLSQLCTNTICSIYFQGDC